MLLYQQKQRSKTKNTQGSIEGIYVPKQMRVEQKRAFCGAHFELGNRNQSKYTSFVKVSESDSPSNTPWIR